MITDAELKNIREIVQEKFHFYDDPYEFMWFDSGYEPVDYCDTFWKDDEVYDVRYGCSKAVLFYKYLHNYVIKIPYLGVYKDNDKCKFKNAKIWYLKDENWDYCRYEEEIYQKACESGIGKLFCGTRYLCDTDDFPIYVSEKSEDTIDTYSSHKVSDKGRDYVRSKRSAKSNDIYPYCPGDMSDNTIGMFYDSWGKELTDALLDFLVDNSIDDCHSSNIAFKDGKIRIIDYTGFYE